MDLLESNNLASSPHETPVVGEETKDEEKRELLDCCKLTIDMHAAFNPMMVCAECKQIIKCFNEEKAFKNYQRFCASRHRKILATEYRGKCVVVFRSYDTYST